MPGRSGGGLGPAPKSEEGTRPQAFMIGDSLRTVIWRDPPKSHPVWTMISKDYGVKWEDDGPLTEEGRQMLITHFGLELAEKDLPLETIAEMSPITLVIVRRILEGDHSLPHHEIGRSTRIGGHEAPEECC